jgi:hypothetical protein
MRSSPPKLIEIFLSNLKTALEQKGFKLDLNLIKRHAQLYRLHVKNRSLFLFIHVSRVKVFLIPSPWNEIPHLIPERNINWAVILLRGVKAQPIGSLIPGNDFSNMKSIFDLTRMGLVKIREKDLSSKYRFDGWDSFFQLLNLQ